MYADLHIHSTASDGTLMPEEIVELALKKNLSVISLTDHDTTDGIVPVSYTHLDVYKRQGRTCNTKIPNTKTCSF